MSKITLPLLSVEGVPLFYFDEEINIQEIFKLYNKLPNLVLTKQEIAESVYYTCAMEGAVSTIADTMNLLDDVKRPQNHSEQMIYNFYNILANPLDDTLFSDILSIRKIWDILSYNAIDSKDSGYPFRSLNVQIKNPFTGQVYHTGLRATAIANYLKMLYAWLESSDDNVIIKSIILHFCFEHWHPFCDCNGRTGRYLMSEYLIRNGLNKFMSLPINTFLYVDKLNYDSSLNINNKLPNITNNIKYMLGLFKKAIMSFIYINVDNEVGSFLRNLNGSLLPNNTPIRILDYMEEEGLINVYNDYYYQINDDLSEALKLYKR